MYRSLAEAIRDAESRGVSLSHAALELEAADAGRPVEEIRGALRRALDVMRGAVAQGLRGDLRSASAGTAAAGTRAWCGRWTSRRARTCAIPSAACRG